MLSAQLFSTLFVFALSHSNGKTLVSADAMPSAQLMPEGMGLEALGEFDILSVRQEGDEDVVHIRVRADNDCEADDCLTYSGWTKTGKQDRSRPEDEVGDEGEILTGLENLNIGARSVLQKRDRKKANVCEKHPALPAGFKLTSPTWGKPDHLEKTYKMVYDTSDPTNPQDKTWFELKRHDKGFSKGLAGDKRQYDAEHVLEWQMLKQFIEEDKDKPDSRCDHIIKHFLAEDPQTVNPKVLVAKDYKKALKSKDDTFDYEEKEFPWKTTTFTDSVKKFLGAKKPRMIDYITNQWPGQAGSKPSNPWEYEMVLLYHDANMRKEVLWGGHSIFVEPDTEKADPKLMKKVEANNESLEWLYINKYYQAKTVKKWEDNKGTCKAIYKYNTAMSLVQYHNDPYIREVMRAQVKRVAAAFDHIETIVLPSTDPAYQSKDLGKQWIEFMKKVHKERLDNLNKVLDEKLKVFEEKSEFKVNIKRWVSIPKWDHLGVFRRAAKEPNCGFEKDKKKLDERVKLLIAAKKKLDKVDSELDLDPKPKTPVPRSLVPRC